MSKTLKRVGTFLTLLLSTSKDQVKALLYTLTPEQASALCEIAYNLLHIPLPPQIRQTVNKRSSLLKKLGDKTIKLNKRIDLIENHQRQFIHTLLLVKKDLLTLL